MTALARLARTRSSRRAAAHAAAPRANALAAARAAAQAHRGRKLFGGAGQLPSICTSCARWLEANGFLRASTVRETGEYALRGGIVDLYPPGLPGPVRLDFFGDTLESIRAFDPETQRTTAQLRALDLVPMNEVQLTTETINRFRQSYIAAFRRADARRRALRGGERGPPPRGLEHWLPLLYGGMDTLFDYVDDAPLLLDHQAEDAAQRASRRRSQITTPRAATLRARPGHRQSTSRCRPTSFISRRTNSGRGSTRPPTSRVFTPFAVPEAARTSSTAAARAGRNFAPERADENVNVFEAAVAHIRALQGEGKRVIVAGWTDGSRERLGQVLAEHGLKKLEAGLVAVAGAGAARAKVALAVIGARAGLRGRRSRRHRRAGHSGRPPRPRGASASAARRISSPKSPR